MTDHSIVFSGLDQVKIYRLLMFRSCLKAEAEGRRLTRKSVYAQVKKEFGLRGSKQKVLRDYETLLRTKGFNLGK